MTLQQSPANEDLRLPFSLSYAHEWYLRFGQETPIDGDLIARRRDFISG